MTIWDLRASTTILLKTKGDGAGLSQVRLKLSNLAPCCRLQPLRPVRARIDNRLAVGDDVGNQVPGSWPDPEAVAAEAGRQDEAWNAFDLTDDRDAIGRAVDIAGPCIGNGTRRNSGISSQAR